MTHRIPALAVLACVFCLTACNKGDTTNTPGFAVDTVEDTPSGLEARGETDLIPREDLSAQEDLDSSPDIYEEVPIGAPCSDAGDCGGGYCIEGPDGGVCVHSCVTECPEGYLCKGVDLYGGDLEFLCVPNWWDLCTSCASDIDCAGDDNLCVIVPGEGHFCGLSCGDTGTCPVGYSCLQAELSVGGDFAWQCLPDEGSSCLCQEENVGEVKPCEDENQFGVCAGQVTCGGASGWGPCDAKIPEQEICNGEDDDCDGEADEGFSDTDLDGEADCVDKDDDGDGIPDELDNCPKAANDGQTDFDNDGLGDACDEDDDNDGWPDPADCKPYEPEANPGAVEDCDGVDNNCNGQVDEGYADTDLDGLANCTDADDDNDGVLDGDDCKPLDQNSYPGATEACDSVDNDCDGKVDEGFPDLDADGIADCTDVDTDGDGDPDLTDCEPTNGAVYNGAPELCDGYDNNCNGQVDEGFADTDQDSLANCMDPDDDNDGDPDATDCAPTNPEMFTGGIESCDGMDNNCNGKNDEGYPDSDMDQEADCYDLDDDNDGDPDPSDCNPLDPEAYNGNVEVCDGKDNDCDGVADENGSQGCTQFYKDKDDDGYGMVNQSLCLCGPQDTYTATETGDCDDSSWSVHPNVLEVCNNQDDDCDGTTDNPGSLGCEDLFEDPDGDDWGQGESACLCWVQGLYTTDQGGDCDEADVDINPGADEECDGIDNNCDGVVDEGVSGTCGNCDPTCNQVTIGPDGDESFTLEDENSSGLAEDEEGNLSLDSEEVSLAFIWIANSGENTVSKLDTTTGDENARYHTCSNPSRTAVDLYGDVWVACRGDGGVAKIIVYEENCPDVNGNGAIETSRDLNGDGHISGSELLPKGQDECVKFIVYPGGSLQRAAGVDAENHAWIGDWYGATLRRLDPETGAVVRTISSLPAQPYGLVVDGDGIIWIAGRGGNKLVRVDPSVEPAQISSYVSPLGAFSPYGITLDYKGRVWMGNCCSKHVGYRFDPETSQWAQASCVARPRGIAGAADGRIYIANDQSNQVAVVDSDTLETLAYVNLGGNRFPVGMAVDFDGYVWALNQSGSSATKIDPDNLTIVGEYGVGSSPYTYSDMTGYSLLNYTSPQGYYQHIIPGGPVGGTNWTEVFVDITFQGESTAKVRVRAADTVASLPQAPWHGPFGPYPPNVFPLALEPLGLTGKYLQVEVVLIPDEDGASPLLKGISVQFHVP